MDRRFRNVQSFINHHTSNGESFKELDNLKVLLNAQMLLQFMIGDLAAITKAYLQSKTEEEHKMRRLVIIKTSTLVHLYGYNDDEKGQSIWRLLMTFLPQSDSSLIEDCKIVEIQLQKLFLIRLTRKNEHCMFIWEIIETPSLESLIQ